MLPRCADIVETVDGNALEQSGCLQQLPAHFHFRADALVARDFGDLVAAAQPLAADLEAFVVRQHVSALLSERVEAHGPTLSETREPREAQVRQEKIGRPWIVNEIESREPGAEPVEPFDRFDRARPLSFRAALPKEQSARP